MSKTFCKKCEKNRLSQIERQQKYRNKLKQKKEKQYETNSTNN